VILGGYIDDLRRLGVRKINISLDTLSAERFEKLTRRDALQSVLANVDKTLEYGFFDVKLNAVLFEETLKELDDFIDYCLERKLVLRFIERMPFTEEDRTAGFISSDRLLDELACGEN
jgi:cyclic pyranopterin phosphate synthase